MARAATMSETPLEASSSPPALKLYGNWSCWMRLYSGSSDWLAGGPSPSVEHEYCLPQKGQKQSGVLQETPGVQMDLLLMQ